MRCLLALSIVALSGCGSAGEASDRGAPAPPPALPESAPARPIAPDPEPALQPPGLAIRIPVALEREIDAAVWRTVDAGGAPGAVVVIGRADGVLFQRAYGRRALEPTPQPMTLDTVFDLASLTKAVATASSIWTLFERGRLSLDTPVVEHVPGVEPRVTVRHLLLHTSGLPAVNPLRDYEGTREEAIAAIAGLPLEHPPGARVRYSDLGYVLLGEVVAAVSGRALDEYAREAVFEPMGMAETRFSPPEAWRARIAPTERAERRGGVLIHGVVHDPRAWRLGGVSGNAGLFSTAADLTRFARGLLGGEHVLSPESLSAMTEPHRLPGGARALGWDVGRAGL
ncbi:MAG: serine hydrolase domain-containing protein, partial [Sandaracinaceae bacterium]